MISGDDYRKLMSMKTVRNNIIHKRERVSKEQADELPRGRGGRRVERRRQERAEHRARRPRQQGAGLARALGHAEPGGEQDQDR